MSLLVGLPPLPNPDYRIFGYSSVVKSGSLPAPVASAFPFTAPTVGDSLSATDLSVLPALPVPVYCYASCFPIKSLGTSAFIS